MGEILSYRRDKSSTVVATTAVMILLVRKQSDKIIVEEVLVASREQVRGSPNSGIPSGRVIVMVPPDYI